MHHVDRRVSLTPAAEAQAARLIGEAICRLRDRGYSLASARAVVQAELVALIEEYES